MLFLLLLELALNDDSSTIKIFHCLHFLILVVKLCSLDNVSTVQLLTDQVTVYDRYQESAVYCHNHSGVALRCLEWKTTNTPPETIISPFVFRVVGTVDIKRLITLM